MDRIGRFNDLLDLIDVFTVNPAYTLTDYLTLTDTFSYEHINSLNDILTLRESYSLNLNTSRILNDTQTLINTFNGSTDNPNTIQNPILVVSNPGVNAPPSPGPSPGPGLGPFSIGVQRYNNQTVTFSAMSGNVTIAAPDFGDKETDTPTIINEETRNLSRIQFRDTIWRDFREYDLSWSRLDENEADSIRVFLRRSVGKAIIYTDIYGNSHTGVIPDPDQPVSSSSSGYSIRFMFLEGTLAT